MQPRVSPFRAGGGLLTPNGPTGRPGRSAVGVGPVGRDPLARTEETPDREREADEFGGADSPFLDEWARTPVDRETAGTVAASIRAGRQFDDWVFQAWWARNRNDVEVVRTETCMRFFRKPFAGALVERTAFREIGPGLERGPWREEPVCVRAFAEAGELSRDEPSGRRSLTEVDVGTGMAKLVARVRDILRRGALLEEANEEVVQTFYVVTMRDVVLARREPSEWQPIASVEVDRRRPMLSQKVVWLLEKGSESSS